MVVDGQHSSTTLPIVKSLTNILDLFKLYIEIGGENQPLFRILELVYRSGARYCLIWDDSNNDEWNAEYRTLYSKIYPPLPTPVVRMDFFSENPISESESGQYFGYVSLRPGPMRTVVESIVRTPPGLKNHYLLCGGKFETEYPNQHGNYVKNTIKDACPFVQQDGVLGICAHASIRMLSMILACNYNNCKTMTVKDIQEKVAAMPLLEGSHLPSTGLASFEIVNAIEGMGASAILYLFEQGRERTHGLSIERVVYPYVESGIPVIVGIETENAGHAVLVVGHPFDRDSWWQEAELGYFPSLGTGISWIPSYAWTPEFIIQDDNFGPYMSCPRTLLGLTTQHVIIPTPPTCPVFLPGYAAESFAAGYLYSGQISRYFLSHTNTTEPWRDILSGMFSTRNVVLRPLLVTKEDFLGHLNNIGLSNETSQVYKNADLSPWVWLVEISVPKLYSNQLKIGEILLNPTYPIQHILKGEEPLLGMRLLDVVCGDNQFASVGITNDIAPVPVLSRTSF